MVTRKWGLGHGDFSSVERNGIVSSKRDGNCCIIITFQIYPSGASRRD